MAARNSQNHPPLSQELDARFSVFLNPIRDLTKNWEVDIAKYLEEYLEELAGLRLSLDGGVTSMNFAEAAMLIQGSATIYSKKVDFLWQMVQKILDLLSSRHTLEAGADGVAGGGGGRKSRVDISLSFSCMDKIQISHNIELQEDEGDDSDSRRKNVKFLPSIPLNLVEKEVGKSQNRISLLVRNNEVLGAKDDFWLTRSYLTPMGVLHLEVPGEMLGATTSLDLQVEEGVAQNIPEVEIHPTPEDGAADHLPSEDASPPPSEDQSPPEDDPLPPVDEDPPLEEDPPPPSEDHPPLPPPQTEDPSSKQPDNANDSPVDISKKKVWPEETKQR